MTDPEHPFPAGVERIPELTERLGRLDRDPVTMPLHSERWLVANAFRQFALSLASKYPYSDQMLTALDALIVARDEALAVVPKGMGPQELTEKQKQLLQNSAED